MRNIQNDFKSILILFFLTGFFCHRFYGIFLPFEADVGQNIYYELNHSLMLADHNPFQWHYSSYMPFVGINNPALIFTRAFFNLFFPALHPIEKALYTNMGAAWLLTFLISLSVFYTLKYLKLSTPASLLGTMIMTFTGFHLVGVREFDHFYLLSYLFVGPTLICFDKICTESKILPWIAWGSLSIGISIIGATNVPLFFYLPFYFFLPIFYFLHHKNRKKLLKDSFILFITTLLGIISASMTLIPGIIYLKDTNRANLAFQEEETITILEKIYSVFLREWWLKSEFPYFHLDFFLGLPVVILFLYGLYFSLKDKKYRCRMDPKFNLLISLLVISFVMTHFSDLPQWFQDPIAWAYTKISIRNPHRFFQIALLPIAYFCGFGWDQLRKKTTPWIILATSTLELSLILFVLIPNWESLLPDQQYAAYLSLGLGILGALTLWARARMPNQTWQVAAIVISIYGGFLFAPVQSTIFPSYFFKHPTHLTFDLNDRLSWKNFLGVNLNYKESSAYAYHRMIQVPDYLKNPETRRGKILDPSDLYSKAQHFYAPQTGHQFAFTNIPDPASPPQLNELAEFLSPSIKDMSGICWELSSVPLERGRITHKIVERPDCFNEVTFVPSIEPTANKRMLLKWMSKATTETFKHHVGINCEETDCSKLPFLPKQSQKAISSKIDWIHERPGYLEFKLEASEPGLILVTIPYRFDWKAFVNQKEQLVVRGNHAYMAFSVPKGLSKVKLVLVRKTQQYANLLSGFTFLLFFIMIFLSRPRR